MKYSDDCKVYRIRYYNVWFYLFAKTEMDEYKINILGERIGMGDSMMMKDIHCWCTRQNIRYKRFFMPCFLVRSTLGWMRGTIGHSQIVL